MKRFVLILALVTPCFFGCNFRNFENFRNNITYTNPRQDECTFTVIQNGTEINHLKCVYWSTEDDDSVFVAKNGKKVYVNGSSLVIEE